MALSHSSRSTQGGSKVLWCSATTVKQLSAPAKESVVTLLSFLDIYKAYISLVFLVQRYQITHSSNGVHRIMSLLDPLELFARRLVLEMDLGVLCCFMSAIVCSQEIGMCSSNLIKSHLHFTGAERRQRLAAFLEFQPKSES